MIEEIIFRLVTILGPLILAITIHEFAHVAMAKFLGDELGMRMGRYTLDPTKHIDLMWTIFFPAILIVFLVSSGAGAVPFLAAGRAAVYDPFALKRPIFGKVLSVRTAEFLVACAGPFANLILAFLVILGLFSLGQIEFIGANGRALSDLFMQFVQINVALFVVNLIPFPPFDGFRILMSLLPLKHAQSYQQFAGSFSLWLLLFLVFGGGALIGFIVQLLIQSMLWFVI